MKGGKTSSKYATDKVLTREKKSSKNVSSKNLKRSESTSLNIEYTADEKKFINDEYPNHCDPYKYVPSIFDAKEKVVVFGDIHGDFHLALDMFTKAKLISHEDEKYKWIGGDTYVVQVGDQIDRCRPGPLPCSNENTTYNDEDSDIKIMEFFNDLALQAQAVGGNVISLLGNHELLNAMGQVHYVSYEGLKGFEGYKDPKTGRVFKEGVDGRIHAFQPGNQYAKMMGCTRYPAVIIGSNIFVHAGIIDALIEEINLKGKDDFEKINIKVRRWLLGLLDEKYVEHIIKYSEHSMFWSRILGKIPPGVSLTDKKCMDNITNVLKLFNVGSIVVGHTPQSFLSSNDINSTCSNKVWRVDNGSSAAFNNFDPSFVENKVASTSRRTQYLEIIDDNTYFVCDGDGCKKEIRDT
jgi:hypothetical protein